MRDGLGVSRYSLQWFTPVQRAEVLGCLLEYATSLGAAWSSPADETSGDHLTTRDGGSVHDRPTRGSAIPLIGSAADLMNCGCADDDDPVLHAVHSITATLAKLCVELLAATGTHESADAAISAVDRKHTFQGTSTRLDPGPARPDPTGPDRTGPW